MQYDDDVFTDLCTDSVAGQCENPFPEGERSDLSLRLQATVEHSYCKSHDLFDCWFAHTTEGGAA